MLKRNEMKVVILFGAGASAFSGECNPCCPPLGDNLFAELQLDGAPASELDEKYVEVFKKDGFEAGLDYSAELGSKFIVPFLQQMAIYFAKF